MIDFKNIGKVFLFLLVLLIVPTLSSAETVTDVNFIQSVNVERGTISSGSVESTRVYNSGYLEISEVTGSVGLLFTYNVSGIQGNVTNLTTRSRYEGGASHDVDMEIYDFEAETWYFLKTYTNNANFVFDTFDISFLNCCDENGNVLIRYTHDASGVDSHNFDTDYLVIESEYVEVEEGFKFFDIDLTDTLTIILITLFLTVGVVIALIFNMFTGGTIIVLTSLFLVFSSSYFVLGFILFIFGFLALFNDDK